MQGIVKTRLVRMRTFSFTLTTTTAAIVIGWGLALRSAQADYLVTLEEQGPDVVATGSGTINLAGLSFLGTVLGNVGGSLIPNEGSVVVGFGTQDMYTGFSGPTNFGPGNHVSSDSDTGSSVGIFGLADILYVPSGYTSNTLLSESTSTYNNASFSSLGVTPGTYEWTWGTGPNQNFTLEIGEAVPEPSTLGLLFLSLPALFGAIRFRSRR